MKIQAALLLLVVTAFVPAYAGVIVTPEPSTFVLVGGGIGAAILIARWKNAKK